MRDDGAANRTRLVENGSLLREAMTDFRAAKNEQLESRAENVQKKDDDQSPFIPLE